MARSMLYKFKSKAAGDVIMLGPNGDPLAIEIERCKTPAHLRELIGKSLRIIAQARGPARAVEFRKKLGSEP